MIDRSKLTNVKVPTLVEGADRKPFKALNNIIDDDGKKVMEGEIAMLSEPLAKRFNKLGYIEIDVEGFFDGRVDKLEAAAEDGDDEDEGGEASDSDAEDRKQVGKRLEPNTGGGNVVGHAGNAGSDAGEGAVRRRV